MKLSDIKKHSVSDRFVERKISFSGIGEDGQPQDIMGTVFVRVGTVKDGDQILKLRKDHGDTAAVIHHNIRFGDGTEVMPIEDVTTLNSSLANALISAINEVNSFTTVQGKG